MLSLREDSRHLSLLPLGIKFGSFVALRMSDISFGLPLTRHSLYKPLGVREVWGMVATMHMPGYHEDYSSLLEGLYEFLVDLVPP